MLKELFRKIFHIEYCILCKKRLSGKDKREGGIACKGCYENHITYHYCKECSERLVDDMLSGKEPKFPDEVKKW